MTSARFVAPYFPKRWRSEISGQHLDTGNEFPYSHDTREPSIPIAFGGALVELLTSLPEYVVPKELHGRCVAVTNRDEAFEVNGIMYMCF